MWSVGVVVESLGSKVSSESGCARMLPLSFAVGKRSKECRGCEGDAVGLPCPLFELFAVVVVESFVDAQIFKELAGSASLG